MSPSGAADIISAIRGEVDAAAEAILCELELALADVRRIESGDASALEQLQQHLFRALEACAFQDLTGQRLSALGELLAPPVGRRTVKDPLLNGPSLAGTGVDQTAADQIMAEAAPAADA